MENASPPTNRHVLRLGLRGWTRVRKRMSFRRGKLSIVLGLSVAVSSYHSSSLLEHHDLLDATLTFGSALLPACSAS